MSGEGGGGGLCRLGIENVFVVLCGSLCLSGGYVCEGIGECWEVIVIRIGR